MSEVLVWVAISCGPYGDDAEAYAVFTSEDEALRYALEMRMGRVDGPFVLNDEALDKPRFTSESTT
jgi:hypothetical protein